MIAVRAWCGRGSDAVRVGRGAGWQSVFDGGYPPALLGEVGLVGTELVAVGCGGMSTTARLARIADLDAVRYIGTVVWPATYGPALGPEYVMNGLDTYWSAPVMAAAIEEANIHVVETASGVVGMTHVEPLGVDLVMWKVYVLPSEQSAGLGHALVSAAKDRARVRGCDLLTEYEISNKTVRGFYEREGFLPTQAPWEGAGAVWLRWRDTTGTEHGPAPAPAPAR